ncbi:MAG: hypothetical protein L0154_22295 [Chloroflexi bacterium]|nr:hypothetical protein [Chloroflexota bacterium]
MIRIYADFNSQDEQGRVKLTTVGSREDIEKFKDVLEEGMVVMLYMSNEFEVEGMLVFDEVWRAIPDYKTIRYLDNYPNNDIAED